MKRPEKLLHAVFFTITCVYLSVSAFYQVFADFRQASLKKLFYQAPELNDLVTQVDEQKITVDCNPICYFLVADKRVLSRTDSDPGGGLLQVKLRFYDHYRGLIGYEDGNSNPNFFVIDTNGEFLQVVRLKLPEINFVFEAYYPSLQLIQFRSSNNKKYLYSANRSELNIL